MGEAKNKARAAESAAHAPKPDPASSAIVASLLAAKTPYVDKTASAKAVEIKEKETPMQRYQRLQKDTEDTFQKKTEEIFATETKEQAVERLQGVINQLTEANRAGVAYTTDLESAMRIQAGLVTRK